MFLEDEMIRGSTVPREISLDKKWVCAPTPMIQEPFFSIPAVVATLVVAASVGGTPSAVVSEPEVPTVAVAVTPGPFCFGPVVAHERV